jgi:hypothetical protein
MRKLRISLLCFTVAALLFSFTLPCYGATVPQLINYQGTLTDRNGVNVPNGNYIIEFKLYDVSTSGTALWTEKWDSTTSQVQTVSGDFNVMLGSYVAIPADFFALHPVTYLGIKVGNDTEMLPRQRIVSVGYAFTAGNGVPKNGIIMWSGSVDGNGYPIVNGVSDTAWHICDGSNGTPDLRDKFVLGAGGAFPSTGGAPTINLAHSHLVNDHTHAFSGTSSGPTSTKHVSNSNDNSVVPDSVHAHTYSGTTVGASNRGTDAQLSSSQSILPPYYALAFIMKL